MNASSATHLPHIVVLGAGFGGLKFCQNFPRGTARITLVDRQNHHLFQPLLYQVATAGLSAPDVAQPVRAILTKIPDLTVLMAEARGFDLAAKTVRLSTGELSYDYLVLALGGVTSYFGHDEWARYAPGLKSLDDALNIRRLILLAFEKAETETDAERRRELMTTVVVGGGPTGVELAGAFVELAHTVLRKDFDHIDPRNGRVILVEGGGCVLSMFPHDLPEKAKQQLERLGVEVRLNSRVQDIRDGEVVLENETIRAGNIIWAAGVAANPLTKLLGVETDRAGRVKVQPDLSVPGHPEVFGLGDLVTLVDSDGQMVPGLAPAAMQMGVHAAKVIAAEIKQRERASNSSRDQARAAMRAPRPTFKYRDKGSMATIGRSKAVAAVGKLRFSGYPAWLAWLLVHLLFLVGFRNKLSVLFHWFYSYLMYKRGARIITGVTAE